LQPSIVTTTASRFRALHPLILSSLELPDPDGLHVLGGAVEKVGVGLAGRVEKLEESVRGVVTAVGVLSRTVEKLGVRFRVLWRTLRDPISEVLLNLSK
jgi:hypothetical protein